MAERSAPETRPARPRLEPHTLQPAAIRQRGNDGAGCPILLVAPEPTASMVAQAFYRDPHHDPDLHIEIAPDVRTAFTALRRDEFSLIVLGDDLAAAEPDAADALFAAAGTAPVLEINFGIWSAERIVRQVRSALARRAAEEAKARRAVGNSLLNELNASLAGLLLESQLALRQAGPEILPTLEHLIRLASELRTQLRS